MHTGKHISTLEAESERQDFWVRNERGKRSFTAALKRHLRILSFGEDTGLTRLTYYPTVNLLLFVSSHTAPHASQKEGHNRDKVSVSMRRY